MLGCSVSVQTGAMGIPGLLKFLKNGRVNLPLQKDKHGQRNRDLRSLINPGEGRTVFVIDGNSWAIGLYCTSRCHTDCLSGGQWQQMYDNIERFVRQLCEAGAQLVFVFDSVRPITKDSTLQQRRWQSSLLAWAATRGCLDVDHKDYWSRQHLVRTLAGLGSLRNETAVEVACAVLQDLSARYAVKLFEPPAGIDGDLAMVAYCQDHTDSVAGVLSPDNDFHLLPHGCKVVGFKLGFNRKTGAFDTRITTVTHPRRAANFIGGQVCWGGRRQAQG